MNIGEKIRKYRKLNKLNQTELGQMIGVVNSTIAKYELNKLEPNLDTLKKISKALNISILDLIDDEESKDMPLKGILSKTNSSSPVTQQIYANIIIDALNSPISLFTESLGKYLSSDDIQQKLNCSDFTGGDLEELSEFLFHMLKLKILEINSKKK